MLVHCSPSSVLSYRVQRQGENIIVDSAVIQLTKVLLFVYVSISVNAACVPDWPESQPFRTSTASLIARHDWNLFVAASGRLRYHEFGAHVNCKTLYGLSAHLSVARNRVAHSHGCEILIKTDDSFVPPRLHGDSRRKIKEKNIAATCNCYCAPPKEHLTNDEKNQIVIMQFLSYGHSNFTHAKGHERWE